MSQVRCLYFTVDKETCMENNNLRKLNSGDHMSGSVSKVVIHSFFKNHEPPAKDEGFSEVIKIAYVPYQRTETMDKKRWVKENTLQ